jgi:hypothetical protein
MLGMHTGKKIQVTKILNSTLKKLLVIAASAEASSREAALCCIIQTSQENI